MPTLPAVQLPGYAVIGFLLAIGAAFMIASILVNRRVARSVEAEQRHREKLYEYYRNTFSQLGVILIGIGVSLFIFFFQQSTLEERRREAELQQILSRLAVRVSRAESMVQQISEYDEILDNGGPYKNLEDGGHNNAVTATGRDLVEQVNKIRLVRRDIDLADFRLARFSADLENSSFIEEIDPHVWFMLVDDEHDLDYALNQLFANFEDLDQALAGDDPNVILTTPAKQVAVKHAVLDILYDIDLLRDRSRRLLGRGCWFLSHGPEFIKLGPIPTLDKRYASHQEWLDEAKKHLSDFSVPIGDCYSVLSPPDRTAAGGN